jgi:hypothetical protein
MFAWDGTVVLLIPAVLLAIWAQAKVRWAYAKYSKVQARALMRGADVAASMLKKPDALGRAGPGAVRALAAVGVHAVPGNLTENYYDPRAKTLNLSEAVYSGRSLAAIGVAAHEAGHAMQDATGYRALVVRSAMVPAANVGSNLGWFLFLAGLLLARAGLGVLMDIGIILFSAAVLFALVTLPVEFNASKRALRALQQGGYLAPGEIRGARAVLSAAAMTYVAAAAIAVFELIRLLVLRSSRN